jgi:hypothetical protein
MRLLSRLLPIVLLVLAACGSKGSVEAKNESAQSVSNKIAASGLKPRPGRWESAMKIEKLEVPGMTPQMQAAMQKSMGVTKTFASCLTPEEVNRPNASFFGSREPGCTYQHFTMEGGQIDGEMTCTHGSLNMHMKMNGTYAEDSYAMHVTNAGEIAPGKTMSTTMSMEAHRVGDCTGKED